LNVLNFKSESMSQPSPIVFVVDDDPSMREALESLIRSAGLGVQTFVSARDFLANQHAEAPGCLVLDVQLPDLNGLDLQQELIKAGVEIPIVFITGYGDIPMSVQAMKAGAAEFLTKPFRDQDLVDAIQQCIARDRAAREERSQIDDLRERYDSLTGREREVIALVASGLLNKQIAAELGLSEITIKVHRAKVMQKMQATSLAELVRMAERLESAFALPLADRLKEHTEGRLHRLGNKRLR
jgi:FixJ family two-component response regulator